MQLIKEADLQLEGASTPFIVRFSKGNKMAVDEEDIGNFVLLITLPSTFVLRFSSSSCLYAYKPWTFLCPECHRDGKIYRMNYIEIRQVF